MPEYLGTFGEGKFIAPDIGTERELIPIASCGAQARPAPAVRKLRRRKAAGNHVTIFVTQRDDTLAVKPGEARRLARALLRASRSG